LLDRSEGLGVGGAPGHEKLGSLASDDGDLLAALGAEAALGGNNDGRRSRAWRRWEPGSKAW
jgi:hypothetical protein